MISIILIIAAAFFNAVMDTLTHHFTTSIFRYKDPKFWDANISWQYADTLRFTSYKIDAWHLSKSAMIICLVAAIVLHETTINRLLEFIIAGTLWNLSFNLFYNKILLCKS